MQHHFSRQDLYDRVWSKPLSRLAAELEVPSDMLVSLLRSADIPKPSAGHWIRKEFGKAVEPPPLPPMPPGCSEPLVLDTEIQKPRRRMRQAGNGPAAATAQRAATTKPVAATKAAPTVKRSVTGMPTATAQTVTRPDEAKAPETHPQETLQPSVTPRPTHPTTLTRDALYAAVWSRPMSRLAEDYGISGNGLAKICDREDIPYPPRGFWAQFAAGKAPRQWPLPESGRARSITIRPTPAPAPPVALPPEVQQTVDKVLATEATLKVQDRLLRPHAVIASWLAEHEDTLRKARSERDPWRRDLFRPKDFSAVDRRRHRILDALFKAIERHGGKATQGERRTLFVETLGEKVEIQLREKQRQQRRPLTDDERRWRTAGANGWSHELVPTGFLTLEVKTWQWPQGLPRQWLETERRPMEDMLPDILATFIAAGPLLVEMRRKWEAEERDRQVAEQRRREEERRRKRDKNQWRRFTEMAHAWQDLATVRDFLTVLRAMPTTSGGEIDGKTIEEWMAWAEDWLRRADPAAEGLESVFGQIAAITDWTYRD